MEHPPNALRAKLTAGEAALGSVVYSWSPNTVETAGFAGLDFVRIDCEHAWRQDSSLENLIRAGDVTGLSCIVRVDRDNPYLVRKALELGAAGVVVPDVCTVEEAVAAVKSAKFPPRGIRGYSGQCRSGGWGSRAGAPWVEWSDREPMVGVMIEGVKAMDNLDEIASVEGLDFLFFGPADYSMSLGLRKPMRDHPDVQAALDRIIAAAQKHGKQVMYGVGADPETIRRYRERGVTMLEMGSDLMTLHAFWRDRINAIRGKK